MHLKADISPMMSKTTSMMNVEQSVSGWFLMVEMFWINMDCWEGVVVRVHENFTATDQWEGLEHAGRDVLRVEDRHVLDLQVYVNSPDVVNVAAKVDEAELLH